VSLGFPRMSSGRKRLGATAGRQSFNTPFTAAQAQELRKQRILTAVPVEEAVSEELGVLELEGVSLEVLVCRQETSRAHKCHMGLGGRGRRAAVRTKCQRWLRYMNQACPTSHRSATLPRVPLPHATTRRNG
jgi:hypothetical protein